MLAALLLALSAQPAPSDPELAVRKLRPAEGLQVALWAAEPQLQNPVSLSIDERGRVFVAETGRHRSSVLVEAGCWRTATATGGPTARPSSRTASGP